MVQLDHIAIRTTDFDRMKAFFEDAFGMKCYSAKGEAPHRILFFLEGIQLNEVEELPRGQNSFDHLAIGVEDIPAVMNYVGTHYPDFGREKDHWIILPDGQTRIELKPYGHALKEMQETAGRDH